MNFGVLLALVFSMQASRAQDDPDICDSTKIMNCFAMSQSAELEQLFFPDTQEKLQSYCNHVMKALNCAQEMAEKCIPDDGRTLYKNLTKDMFTTNTILCSPNSTLNQRFLTHVNCYKKLSPKFETCSDRYIENIVAARRLSQTQQILKTCCSVHDYSCCMRNVVTGRCEKDAVDLVDETAVRTLGSPIEYCNQYKEVSDSDCRKCLATQDGLSSDVEKAEYNSATQFCASATFIYPLLTLPILRRILAK